MTRDEFAALGGVLPAVVTRKTAARMLWGPGGQYDPDFPVNQGWLIGRFAKLITDAQVFGRVPLGWSAYAATVDGKRVVLWMVPEVPGGSRWGRWLPGSQRFEIDTATMTATEKTTGRVFEIEALIK